MRIANADKLKNHFEHVVMVKLFTVPEILTIIDTFSTENPEGDKIVFHHDEDGTPLVTNLSAKQEMENIFKSKGKWNECNDDKFDWVECSECGFGDEGENTTKWLYCPACGALMVNSPMNKLGGTQP